MRWAEFRAPTGENRANLSDYDWITWSPDLATHRIRPLRPLLALKFVRVGGDRSGKPTTPVPFLSNQA